MGKMSGSPLAGLALGLGMGGGPNAGPVNPAGLLLKLFISYVCDLLNAYHFI